MMWMLVAVGMFFTFSLGLFLGVKWGMWAMAAYVEKLLDEAGLQ